MHTVHSTVGVIPNDQPGAIAIRWCPRCGTIASHPPGREIDPRDVATPRLVNHADALCDRVRALGGKIGPAKSDAEFSIAARDLITAARTVREATSCNPSA